MPRSPGLTVATYVLDVKQLHPRSFLAASAMARVTMASPALAVLLLLGLGAVHAAQDNYPSFFEVSSQALAGKASQRVRTLSSDGYGYSKMEQTCLEDTQIKNCRVTGCLSCADGIADGGSFQ